MSFDIESVKIFVEYNFSRFLSLVFVVSLERIDCFVLTASASALKHSGAGKALHNIRIILKSVSFILLHSDNGSAGLFFFLI